MKKPIIALPHKAKLAAILAISFMLCFMVFIFVPFELYLNSPTDFIVSWKFLLLPLVTMTIAGSVIITAIYVLLWNERLILGITIMLICALAVTIIRFVFYRLLTAYLQIYMIIAAFMLIWVFLIKVFKKNAADILLLIAWGGVISAYVQMLFLNGEMVLLTGDMAGYATLSAPHILNAAIWVIVTIMPCCIWKICKVKGKTFKFEKAILFSMVLIGGMQIAGLVSAAVTTDVPTGFDEGVLSSFSYEATMNLNTENNVIVFILDRLDVAYMSEALEEYPEIADQLDGFTFYKNNVSEYGQTFPSVTTMLTERRYDINGKKTFSEYWEEAWGQHSFIDTLRESGFSTNLYIDKLSTFGSLEEIQDKTDNLDFDVDLKVFYMGILNMSARLSLGRMAPYFLKNIFLAPLDSTFGNNFFVFYSDDDSAVTAPTVSLSSDLDFFRYISKNEVSSNNEKKVFNFIHLNCAHVDSDRAVNAHGYHYDNESSTVALGGNYIESIHACFTMLDNYFESMKRAGVYDSSTIILVADHGAATMATASLFIKPQNAVGILKINTLAEMSNKYFGSSVLEAAGLSSAKSDISYFDIIDGYPPPKRIVYRQSVWWTARETTNTLLTNGTYEITGDANDFKNWKYFSNG